MADGERRLRRWRRAGWTAGAFAGVAVLWWLVGVLFSSDRGLDLHDEGLYLLAADHGNLRGTWTTPFGWHTRPFFLLLGESISRLRTFAVVALVVVGAGLGGVIGRRTVPGHHPHDRATRALLATVGGLGGPMLTASLLRTPGYNWVNLVGLTVAAAGLVLATRLPPGGPVLRSPATLAAVATTMAGAWFAAPGKPTSAIAVALVGVALLCRGTDRRRLASLVGLAVAFGIALVLLSVAARIWPADFLRVLRTGATVPPLHENQTIGGALRDVVRTPKVAFHDLRHLRVAALLLVVLAIVAAAAAPRLAGTWRRRHRDLLTLLRISPLALCTIAAVGTAAPWPLLGGPSPAYRFAWFGTTNAAVLLIVGSLLHLVAHRDRLERDRVMTAARIAVMLLCLTVAFGLGSAMSVYHQAALAAVLLWCAAAALVVAAGDAGFRTASTALLAVAALAMFTTNLADSRAHPLLYTDVSTHNERLELGRHGDMLLVDDATIEYLHRLRAGAEDAGFCPGTPLLGFEWQWSATEQFVLGAEVPDMLLLTIFGYPDPFPVLDHSLRTLDPQHWSAAWIITTDPATLAPDDATELRAALGRLPASLGRTFPDDYVLATQTEATQLWRPAGSAPVPCR